MDGICPVWRDCFLIMKRRTLLLAGILNLAGLAGLSRAEQAVLFEKVSPYNTVVVTEEGGMRTLRFERGGARQTVIKPGDPDHLELSYARAVLVGLALCEGPRRVLVVGLGGGTLPMFLRRHYPDAEIDAVDIDPEVVAVAKEYFGFREDSRMRAVVGDGRGFVEKSDRAYDMVILDAFGSDSVPRHLTTQEFLQAVRRIVEPGGVVVGNVWSRHSNPLYDSMVRTYQEVFDELYILNLRGAGNQILLALPRRQALTVEELAGLALEVVKARRFRYDLGEIVRRGFEHAVARDPEARVLVDADLVKEGGTQSQ